MNESIVIVGAGQCGATAALTLREAGFGGRIVLIGDEPIAPYERPPLSKAVLCDETPKPAWVVPPERYAEMDVEYFAGVTALSIDARAQTVQTTRGAFRYTRLLLASGGRARKSPLPAPPGDVIATLRTWDDAMKLRALLVESRHLTVVGGGLVGLEVAASARLHGLSVAVVEAAPALLSRLVPEAVGRRLLSVHRQHGVEVFLDRTLKRITRRGRRWRIALTCGERWETDVIIAGIGLIVPTDLAAAAGCRCDDGVLVDERGETSVPGIFAAGDCARFRHPALGQHTRWENWQHAIRHGAHVAACMSGRPSVYDEVCRGWTDQFDTTLQIVGDPVLGSRLAIRETSPDSAVYCSFEEGRIVGAVGWNAPRDVRALQRIVQKGLPADAEAISDATQPLAATFARRTAASAR